MDGNLAESREVTLAPDGDDAATAEYVFSDLPVGARTVEAKLAGADVYPLDNSAYTVLDVGRRSEILLVTNGNVFLEKVLSLLPTGEVSRVAAAPLPGRGRRTSTTWSSSTASRRTCCRGATC